MNTSGKERVTLTRDWITFWDRANHRVLLLGNRVLGEHHWTFVSHDPARSRKGEYDIWSTELGAIVVVEVHLDEADRPRGFPHQWLPDFLLGSPTIWPAQHLDSFVWWHPGPTPE